jgi:phosphoglycolate phosphatase
VRPEATPPALIFDFDGTLVDTLMTLLNILYELAHHTSLPHEDISRIRAMTLRQVLRELDVAPFRALLLWRGAYRMLSDRMNDITIVPGIDDMLKKLSQQYDLYILSSNRTTNVTSVLERYGLQQYIAAVRGSANPFDKTHSLRQLARRHHLIAAETWYIGDQPGDILAAHHVGLKAAAVSWGFSNLQVLEAAKPDFLGFTPEEIVHYFHKEVQRV